VRPNAAPKGISSGRIGTRTAARVRPRCGRTCLSHLLHTPGLQASPAFSPSGQNEFRHNVDPSPRSRSAGIKVARPRHWKFTPKEAVTPLMNRRYATGYPGARLGSHKYAQKGIHAEFALGRLGNNSRKTAFSWSHCRSRGNASGTPCATQRGNCPVFSLPQSWTPPTLHQSDPRFPHPFPRSQKVSPNSQANRCAHVPTTQCGSRESRDSLSSSHQAALPHVVLSVGFGRPPPPVLRVLP
jgi:hypothetical protein